LIGYNLQFFAQKDKIELLEKIKKGDIDESEFYKCLNYFNEKFNAGVETPIGIAINSKDRYYHIINGHPEMLGMDNIDRMSEALVRPRAIFETVDRYGIKALCYLEKKNNKPLIVIERSGINTSYEPQKIYL